MNHGILVTMILSLKPETAAPFLVSLEAGFADTKLRKGFRSIRVDRHQQDPNKVILREEWDSAQDYGDYIAWRTERGDMEAFASVLAAPPQVDIWTERVAQA
jgi:quinol monooxygenase YgiN